MMHAPAEETGVFLAHSLQVSLGLVFLAAVLPKLSSPTKFGETVAAYRVVPARTAPWVAAILIGSEVVLAVALMSGWLVELALPLATLTVTAFILGVAINLKRGRQISCGCFGLSDDREKISTRSLVRLVFLLLAITALMAAFYSGATSSVSLSSISGNAADVAAYLIDVAAVSAGILLIATWLLTLPELWAAAIQRPPGGGTPSTARPDAAEGVTP